MLKNPFKKSSYNYQQILKDLIPRLQTLESQEGNLTNLFEGIVASVEANSGGLFVISGSQTYTLKMSTGIKPLIVSVAAEHEFLQYIKSNQIVYFKNEIVHKSDYMMIRSPGIHFFTQTNSMAIVSLKVQDEWLGFLTLGAKKTGEDYTEEDRDYLEIMGYFLAYHVSNDLLFSRVRNQNVRLSEVTEIKNQLMSNVTHELRTPLNGILGLTDIILDGSDGPITEDQRHHLELIRSSGESILAIVNNILSLIKVEADKREIKVGRVDLNIIIKEVLGLFENVMSKKGITFDMNIDEDSFVYGNEDQIRTVFMNLVSNAVKFTHQGQISVTSSKSGEMIKIIIKDTGAGIEVEHQSRIFEEFFQIDGSQTRSHEGAGLGLAVVKRIVELHGGRVGLSSKPNLGSEFFLTFPTKPDRYKNLN